MLRELFVALDLELLAGALLTLLERELRLLKLELLRLDLDELLKALLDLELRLVLIAGELFLEVRLEMALLLLLVDLVAVDTLGLLVLVEALTLLDLLDLVLTLVSLLLLLRDDTRASLLLELRDDTRASLFLVLRVVVALSLDVPLVDAERPTLVLRLDLVLVTALSLDTVRRPLLIASRSRRASRVAIARPRLSRVPLSKFLKAILSPGLWKFLNPLLNANLPFQ